MANDTYISVQGVTGGYGESDIVLDNVSLDIRQGEFVCILGPSGCGKSTLLSLLSGLMRPRSGSIVVNGVDVHAGSRQDNAAARLGFVFQDHRLLPWRTIEDNVKFALRAAGIPEATHDSIVHRYLEMLEIDHLANAWPLNVSGGQRQRASIARALAVDPLYVLMDEPFSTLDEVTGRTMREELLRVWAESGKTIIFVTHSVREAVYLADRVFAMVANPGKLYRTVDIDIPRVRSYDDPRIAEIEVELIEDLLQAWGMKSGGTAKPSSTGSVSP